MIWDARVFTNSRKAGSSPPSSYFDNDPSAAQDNHYQCWIDDRPGTGDGDFNDIGFDIIVNGDGTVTVKNLQKSAGDTFDLIDAETGAVIAKNIGGGGQVSARVAGGRASYAVNGLASYAKLSTRPDKIIACSAQSWRAGAGSAPRR